jgi:serine/threonine protein kinase
VHHKLNHPNIIKLQNYYYEQHKNITYMVLEYASGGSLHEKVKFGLGQLSKNLIRKYFR